MIIRIKVRRIGGKNVFVLQAKSINALCAKYHTSLDEGMNCVGSDKFPALSNGILKPHILLWLFRNSLLQFSRSYREITFSSGKSAVITGKHTCLYCWGLWIRSVSFTRWKRSSVSKENILNFTILL